MVQIFSKYLFSQITLGQEVVLLCWKWIKMAAANPKTGTGLSVRPEDEIGSIADRCLQVPILSVLSFSLPFQEEVNVHFRYAALLCVHTRQMLEAHSGARADVILLR